MKSREQVSKPSLRKQVLQLKKSVTAVNDRIFKAYQAIEKLNPYLPRNLEDMDDSHLTTLKLKGLAEDSKAAQDSVIKLEAKVADFKKAAEGRFAIYQQMKKEGLKRSDVTYYLPPTKGQAVKVNKVDLADVNYLHARHGEYVALVAAMGAIHDAIGQLKNVEISLELETDEGLANAYQVLTGHKSDGLSREECIEGIQVSFSQIERDLREQLDQLSPHYIKLRKKIDSHYRETLHKAENIQKALKAMEKNLTKITDILAKNNSTVSAAMKELQENLKNILLLNSLNQSDFNEILDKYIKVLKKLEARLKIEFKDKPEILKVLLDPLTDLQGLLSGKFKEEMNDFRSSFLSESVGMGLELLVPVVFSVLNAVNPIPMPQLGSFDQSASALVYNAGKAAASTAASSLKSSHDSVSQKEKTDELTFEHPAMDTLNKEWQQVWYLEALKKANLPQKVAASVGTVMLGITLTALGAPHLVAVLVPAGLSASSTAIPKALENIDKLVQNKTAKKEALGKLTELEKQLAPSTSSSAKIAVLLPESTRKPTEKAVTSIVEETTALLPSEPSKEQPQPTPIFEPESVPLTTFKP